MKRTIVRMIARRSFAFVVVVGVPLQAQSQNTTAPYPSMAPLDQYLIADRNAEIAMAQSAAPASVSRDAEVLVLGRHGYETAVKGKNGFVCVVQRSWIAPIDDPGFWNPKGRAPICLNPPAVRSFLPLIINKTDLVLAGRSKAQMFEGVRAAFEAKQLPAAEPGAMGYMMSGQAYLSDHDPRWHPHLMFFLPPTGAGTWGANLPGSPILAFKGNEDRVTVVLIPVATWSDGTIAPTFEQ